MRSAFFSAYTNCSSLASLAHLAALSVKIVHESNAEFIRLKNNFKYENLVQNVILFYETQSSFPIKKKLF